MNIEQLLKHNIKPQSLAHRILGHLLNAAEFVQCSAIRGAVAPSKRISDIREQTVILQRLGLVICDTNDRAALSKTGIEAYSELGPLANVTTKPRSNAVKKSELMSRPPYDPVELGKTCMRPGAYDAYRLPSILSGKPVIPTWRNL